MAEVRGKDDEDGISYKLFEEKDLEELIEIHGTYFPIREPTMRAAKITPEQEKENLRIYAPHVIKSQCSYIARDKRSGQIVGYCLAYDNACPEPEVYDSHGEEYHRFFEFYELVDRYASLRYERIDPDLVEEEGQVLYLFYLLVCPGFEGRGIAVNCVKKVLETGRALGYRVAYADASARASQTLLCQKAGMRCFYHVPYLLYSYHGEQVYRPCVDSGEPSIELTEIWFGEDLAASRFPPQEEKELQEQCLATLTV